MIYFCQIHGRNEAPIYGPSCVAQLHRLSGLKQLQFLLSRSAGILLIMPDLWSETASARC
jgi:hypothetical protein